MASLKNQLEKLAPLIDHPDDSLSLLRSLLMANDEGHYRDHVGNVMHQIGLMDTQSKIYSFDMDQTVETIAKKLKLLLANADVEAQLDTDSWGKLSLTTGEHKFEIKHFPTRYGRGQLSEIIQIPPVFKTFAETLKKILPNGTFYLGYLPDAQYGLQFKFSLFLIFIDRGSEDILKRLSAFEWRALTYNPNGTTDNKDVLENGKVESIKYGIYKDKMEFRWLSRSNTITGILFVLLVVILVGLFQKVFFDGIPEIPYRILFYILAGIVPFAILDYFNQSVKISVSKEQINLIKGSLPFFPGYRRKNFHTKEIIKVWHKLKHYNSAGSEMPMDSSTGYVIYLTTTEPKEVRLTGELQKNEAEFIEGKLENYLSKASTKA